MNKIVRVIGEARSRLRYSQPVYIPGYEYSPWKNVLAAALILAVVVIPVVSYFFFGNKDAFAWLFTLLLFAALIALIWGVAAPSQLSSKLPVRNEMSRKWIVVVFGLLSLIFFTMIGITAPTSANTAANRSSTQGQGTSKGIMDDSRKAGAKSQITTKYVQETRVVPYKTVTKYDSSLPSGQSSVNRAGVNGIETYLYVVTFTGGQETSRALDSRTITVEPIDKIAVIGTYVEQQVEIPQNQGSGYTNVDGNHIDSPSSNPTGASAQCRDGTYSYSANRRGTCSHHGGVARWF